MNEGNLMVVKRDGQQEPLDINKIHKVCQWATEGLDVSLSELETEAHLTMFDGIKTADIHESLIRSAATLITKENPEYTFVAARLLLQRVFKEVTGGSTAYPSIGPYVLKAMNEGRLHTNLWSKFEYARLDAAIVPERDLLFTYIAMQTLADRYLIRTTIRSDTPAKIIELPQHMWMRVAMGLAVNEKNPTDRAIEFYNVLSKLEFISSTPTLFNSGTPHSQMSSCYLNTVADSISSTNPDQPHASIFGTLEECARLSKFAGGIGTDWTRVRNAGQPIKSTNGESSGVVPYLKIYNDTAVAVNQGGKRNGAFSPYLEVWHPDFMDFCELKKNSGDPRRRTYEIFPAAWVADLFMKRVQEKGIWSFFAPNEFPELHDLYGEAFEKRYEELESLGLYVRQLPAVDVWRKILTMLFETGHPWITFKDPCNLRNPQKHAGVIHSSNLCTEITLNTSDGETAVCNLGSVNLSRMRDSDHLRETIRTGMRMLDNVIDINFYPSERARVSNLNHRPVGIGVMGYAEFLVQHSVDFESEEHLELADALFEEFSYYAIEASVDLAEERGAYPTFDGSDWSKGILPIDNFSAKRAFKKRPYKMDWDALSKRCMKGMRNSNTMAIAPTATIGLIAGTTACIEPIFQRSYTETTLSGPFLMVDPCLKYGKPELCKEAFEIDQKWLIQAAGVRQKWIDQSQSVNLFVTTEATGATLSEMYMFAWECGLKTTYYLRNQSQVLEKTQAPAAPLPQVSEVKPPITAGQGWIIKDDYGPVGELTDIAQPKVCSIDNPNCESCAG